MKNNVLVIIDASGKDSFERLVLHRMPGALPFAGKYRLIDFALSNVKNAGITNVAIFPYGNYRSLQDHVGSGKRWDLDRRRDGLFILPPKNLAMPTETMLTFQRMHEHIEYLKRSSQEIVFVMPASIVWSIDILEHVQTHLESNADISEIMHDNIRFKSYIIPKSMLLSYAENYDALPYQTIQDITMKAPGITVNTIHYQGYARYITDPFNYLKSNLAMLRFDIGKTIFSQDRPIYSKEKPAPPARYLDYASVTNSMVSSGSFINGVITNSIIGRDVIIEKNAHVSNSMIMSNAVIEENTHVDYAILDKGTIVKKGTFIEGSLREPFVSKKDQIITNQTDLSILMVSTESTPFVKTGGLADVVNDLSRNLVKKGVKTSVILPLFEEIKTKYSDVYKKVASKRLVFNQEAVKVRLHFMIYKNVNYYFIEHYKYFERETIYGHDDDCLRFAFFNEAVLLFLDDIESFDIIHIHDWHAGLIPLLLKERDIKIPTMLTIHNIDYQGVCHQGLNEVLQLKRFIKEDHINFLEQAILHATLIQTVSPTYRDELRYEYFGKNLTYALLKRERDFHGVLNGVSSRHDPATDQLILSNYSVDNVLPKLENKLFLQETMHLDMGVHKWIVGMVTRITEQKGFELITQVLEGCLEHNQDMQFVLLGTGDSHYIERLKQIEQKFPNRVKLNIGFHATVPNYIYAGADVLLMPSRVEPCGLSQMIAMKYGTLPIVKQTGGLNDTVVNYDPVTKKGTGFSFYNYDTHTLKQTIFEAYTTFKNHPKDYQKLIKRGMRTDFSLSKQASKMIELYQMIAHPEK